MHATAGNISLRLADDQAVLFWHLQLHHYGSEPCEIAPVLVQDVAEEAGYERTALEVDGDVLTWTLQPRIRANR